MSRADEDALHEHGETGPKMRLAQQFSRQQLPHRRRDETSAQLKVVYEQKYGAKTGIRGLFGNFTDDSPTGYRVRHAGEPEEEGDHLYPVCNSSVRDLGDFGIGVALYFNSLAFLSFVLLICGFISLPTIISNASKNPDGTPAQVVGTTAGMTDFRPVQGWTDFVICIVLTLAGLLSSRLEDRKIAIVDKARQTAQDYAVEVKNALPSIRDPDVYKQFFSKFGNVVSVTIALDNGKLLRLRSQLLVLKNHIEVVRAGLRKKGATTTDMAEDAEHIQRSCCTRCLNRLGCGRDLAYWVKKREALEEDIKDYMQEGFEFRPCKAFIVFEEESGQRKCLSSMKQGALARSRGEPTMENRLVVEAPEPSDIRWEYLHVPHWKAVLSQLGTYLASALILGASFGVLLALEQGERDTTNTTADITSSQYILNISSAVFIVSLNQALPRIMKAFVSFFETHKTFSSFQASLMTKLVIVRIMNTAVLTFFVTPNKAWLSADTVGKIVNILVTDLILSNALRLFDPYTMVNRYLLSRRSLTQWQMNMAWSGVSWNLGERYTDLFKTLFVSLYYATLVPTGFFITSLCFILMYWVDKYLLLRRWAVAPELDATLARTSRRFFQLTVYAHAWAALYFIGNWPFTTVPDYRRTVDTSPRTDSLRGFTTLFFVLVVVLSVLEVIQLIGVPAYDALVNCLCGNTNASDNSGMATATVKYTDVKGISEYLPHAEGFAPDDIDLAHQASIVKYYTKRPEQLANNFIQSGFGAFTHATGGTGANSLGFGLGFGFGGAYGAPPPGAGGAPYGGAGYGGYGAFGGYGAAGGMYPGMGAGAVGVAPPDAATAVHNAARRSSYNGIVFDSAVPEAHRALTIAPPYSTTINPVGNLGEQAAPVAAPLPPYAMDGAAPPGSGPYPGASSAGPANPTSRGPAYPGAGSSGPAYPGAGNSGPAYPGASGPAYPGAGSSGPAYPGAGAGSTGSTGPAYPGAGAGSTGPAYPGAGAGSTGPAYPGAGAGSTGPAYPGAGAGSTGPAYPGAGSTGPAYPGAGAGSTGPAYPGAGAGSTGPAYPGAGAGSTGPAYPGAGGPAYPGAGSTGPAYPSNSGPAYPSNSGPAYPGTGSSGPAYPNSS